MTFDEKQINFSCSTNPINDADDVIVMFPPSARHHKRAQFSHAILMESIFVSVAFDKTIFHISLSQSLSLAAAKPVMACFDMRDGRREA